MTVGEKIKMLRKERGLTQEELGQLLGVKKAAVQKYESGQVQNLKQNTIKKLCEIFNTYPSYFIIDSFSLDLEQKLVEELHIINFIEQKYGNDVINILEIIVSLDDKNKAKVLDYAGDLAFIQSVRSVR